ncbi:CHASE2 domain-containing protein [Leptothoe spongobia]|uniref:CHASE2 domain-containing protein n=1 Tax=Leptothoe spongobia TAU-MAC 1115 TaxID=1967444 RepID=A0A947GKX4_9CYAN|nr:CHASE2 domain-containing protein [Leptothoe spongobia]MBT9316902.1 CHASE2 domain-containing protein [Leptothoe spongobia TAU-MAC 1115]
MDYGMDDGMGDGYIYQPGGSLPPNAPSYIPRQADDDLFKALLAGTYCYVLTSRQMGKSSLRVRTVERLYEAGVRCAEVELLGIGSQEITANQWYGGIIQVLISSLGLRINRRQWLRDHGDLSPVQRLGTFIEQVVLPQTHQPLVLFFDEIDSVLGLNFPTDDFFGLLRNWHEQRANQPAYDRLTVVMLGVATPSDLMQNSHATPFNIGRAIELQAFSLADAQPLLQGLATVTAKPNGVLREILDWTGGQPFLTQKVCQLYVQEATPRSQESGVRSQVFPSVRTLIQTRILDNWQVQDEPEHLRTIQSRLLRNVRSPQRSLRLYRQILKRGAIPADNSFEQRELRLTGLVTRRQGQLQVFNRIYGTVFDRAWIARQLAGLAPPVSNPPWQLPWMGLGATILVLLVRSLGLLQPLELVAFDQLLRSQPPEPADDRFLIITVSEADMQYQDRLGMKRQGSLSDDALLQVWQKIKPHDPRVFGLDLYHDFPFSPALAAQLPPDDRFIGVCEIGQTVEVDTPVSIPSPPNVSADQLGFTDFAIDPDYRIRRQLLGVKRTDVCDTDMAFSLQLTLRYLVSEGITLDFLSSDLIQLGDLLVPKISPTAGGYRLDPEEQAGYQILVNYRSQSPRQVTLRELLEGQLDDQLAEWSRDRIVLIGLAEPKDAQFTPKQSKRMLGVTIHAQQASQLISATLDDRPLIWWLPEWGEGLWILVWTVGSNSVVWGIYYLFRNSSLRSRFLRNYSLVCVVVLAGMTMSLLVVCYLMLLIGGWLPLVPPLLATALSLGGSSNLTRPKP